MWSWNELRIAFHFADLLILLMLWTAANELEFFPECLEGRTATHRRDESPAIRAEKNESIQFCLGMLSFVVQTFSIITRNSKIKLKLVVILIMFAEIRLELLSVFWEQSSGLLGAQRSESIRSRDHAFLERFCGVGATPYASGDSSPFHWSPKVIREPSRTSQNRFGTSRH